MINVRNFLKDLTPGELGVIGILTDDTSKLSDDNAIDYLTTELTFEFELTKEEANEIAYHIVTSK